MAPKSIILEILKIYHNSIFGLHLGQNKTCQNIKKDFYWKTIRSDVRKHIEKCHSCNLYKSNYQPPPQLQRSTIPTAVWTRISMDIVGPLNITQQGNKYVLTCIDFLTRYAVAVALPNIKAETVAEAFVKNIITNFGTPKEILTDCGKQFVGKLFVEICKILNIRKLQTTPYHPAANGIIERFHKTLKQMIAQFVDEYNNNWDEILPFALMAYRNNISEATGDTPFFLMFGRDMILPHHLTVREID
jgi:transposase InsO family protein